MAQDYINSNSISVFPMAVNRTVRPTDNTLSERNLASLITSIVDVDRFVVEKCDSLRFVLAGYHFEIYDLEDFLSSHSTWSDIWATVQVDMTNKDVPYLKGVDTDGKFQAVTFSDIQPENANTIVSDVRIASLKILEKANGEWIVPETSGIKFNQSSIGGLVVDIDGGEIE
jgi:hypothetical protein